MNIKVYLQTTGLCLAKQKVEPIQNRMLPLANQEDNDKLKSSLKKDFGIPQPSKWGTGVQEFTGINLRIFYE